MVKRIHISFFKLVATSLIIAWKGSHLSLMWPPSSLGTLEPHLSALLWMAMLVSLAIVIILPQPHGIRALIASTILRLIFSVGLEPTLLLLGGFNVSMFRKAFVQNSCAMSHLDMLYCPVDGWLEFALAKGADTCQTLTKHYSYWYRTYMYTVQEHSHSP